MACRSTCFLVAVATLLGACTLEPHYQRPPAPGPALQGGMAGEAGAADIGWREFFPDPQLQQLIALALTNNRDLRIAALNVQSAQAQYRIQRAELFPTVDASAVHDAACRGDQSRPSAGMGCCLLGESDREAPRSATPPPRPQRSRSRPVRMLADREERRAGHERRVSPSSQRRAPRP